MVALKRSLPRLTVSKKVASYLYVKVTLTCSEEVTCAANVDVALKRPATILENGSHAEVGFTLANVWEENWVLLGGWETMSKQVKDTVEEGITNFAAEYYKSNQ